VKYVVTDHLDVIGAYYYYDQPVYGIPANFTPAGAATPTNCHGSFDAVSFVVDWQFAKKFDTYAGFMFSQVNGGWLREWLPQSQQHRSNGWAALPLLRKTTGDVEFTPY
jgi:hypothetical protein